jgi:hypothetical protein
LDTHVYFAEIPPAYGLWIALTVPWLFTRRAWRWIWCTSAGRLWLAWVAAVWILLLNDHFLEHHIQPSHFTRGWLWLPLLISSLLSLRWMARAIARRPTLRAPVPALIVLTLLLIPDNVLFLMQYLREEARASLVNTVPRENWEAVEWLRTQEESRVVAVVEESPLYGLDYLIPSFTYHDALLGHAINGSRFRERNGLVIDAYRTGDFEPLLDHGVNLFFVRTEGLAPGISVPDGHELWRSDAWRALEID